MVEKEDLRVEVIGFFDIVVEYFVMYINVFDGGWGILWIMVIGRFFLVFVIYLL